MISEADKLIADKIGEAFTTISPEAAYTVLLTSNIFFLLTFIQEDKFEEVWKEISDAVKTGIADQKLRQDMAVAGMETKGNA